VGSLALADKVAGLERASWQAMSPSSALALPDEPAHNRTDDCGCRPSDSSTDQGSASSTKKSGVLPKRDPLAPTVSACEANGKLATGGVSAGSAGELAIVTALLRKIDTMRETPLAVARIS